MKYLITIIACYSVALGTESNQNSLIQHSPFIPEGWRNNDKEEDTQTSSATESALHFTLKGIVQLSGTYYFSIFDQTTQRSAWLEDGESFNGLTIIGLNELPEQLIVRYNHIEQILPLAHADDTPIPVLASTSTPYTSAADALQVTMISRRPRAFTANLQRATEAAPNIDITARQPSTPNLEFGSQQQQTPISNALPNTATLETPTTNKTELSKPHKNRFGIDQSRISGTW